MNQYVVFFGMLLTAVPLLAIAAAAIVLALRRWPQHPRASGFSIVGLGLLIAKTLGSDWLQARIRASGAYHGGALASAAHLATLNIVSYGLNIAGIAFIVAAVFANRTSGRGGV